MKQLKYTSDLYKTIFFEDEINQENKEYIDIVYCYSSERNSHISSGYGDLRIIGLYK